MSGLSTLVVPKFIGVTQYGYWQLFIFYGSYVLLIQLGVSSGANLRYTGMSRQEVAGRGLGIQGLALLVFTLAAAVSGYYLAPFLIQDSSRVAVLRLTVVFAVLANVRHFLVTLLQSVADFRSFSRVTLIDRLLFVVAVIVLIGAGASDFKTLAASEIIAKGVSVLLAYALVHDMLKFDFKRLRLCLTELLLNVYAGLKLTLASTSSQLVVGIVRFQVDRAFGVAVFGAVSLVLNLSSLFMVFINSVGLVLFPALRRTPLERLPQIYTAIRLPLSVGMLSTLLLSHPISALGRLWLPEFQSGWSLVSILMPMIVFEARMALLIMPFLKTLRRENFLLWVNLLALGLSTVLSLITTTYLQSVELSVLVIVVSLAARCLLAEIHLRRRLGQATKPGDWVELGLAGCSIAAHVLAEGWWGTAAYSAAWVVYVVLVRKRLISNIGQAREMLRGA